VSSIRDCGTIFGQDLSLHPPEVAAALTRVTPWLDANLRHVADPGARVKGLLWNVGDVAAHVAALLEDYRGIAEGGAPLGAPATQRQRIVDAGLVRVSERRPPVLADRIGDDIGTLARVVASSRSEQKMNWYAGTAVTPALLGAVVLGEVLVHGWDIATASHGDTTLDPAASHMGVVAAAAVCDLLLSPKGKTVTSDIEFRIRGYESIGLRIGDGHVRIVQEPMRRPDLWFAGAPGPFLLWTYLRTGTLGPFVKRSIHVGGRRPWRALAVAKWFETV
jgi:uncharacterized protein (TIGR03083 family)